MNELKIKITLGSFTVELEGDSLDVISQLEEIKKNGLGQIVDQLIPLQEKRHHSALEVVAINDPKVITSNYTPTTENMTLFDLVLKMLPGPESEWVLVYGYFCTIEGSNTFTREDIIRKYDESKRKKRSNLKNLSNSIKAAAKNGWISQQNDTEFMVTPLGHKVVQEVFQRTEPTNKAPRSIKKSTQTKKDLTEGGN